MTDSTQKIRARLLSLIDSEFTSDAAFEREMGLKEKTVSNWRRGKSASFMGILPSLANRLSVNIGELIDIPLSSDTSELSEEELQILHLYRKARTMPQPMRAALRETLEHTINMYITSYQAVKAKKSTKAKSDTSKG
jgi:transcriptional regulator with XRE-family HTH domain